MEARALGTGRSSGEQTVGDRQPEPPLWRVVSDQPRMLVSGKVGREGRVPGAGPRPRRPASRGGSDPLVYRRPWPQGRLAAHRPELRQPDQRWVPASPSPPGKGDDLQGGPHRKCRSGHPAGSLSRTRNRSQSYLVSHVHWNLGLQADFLSTIIYGSCTRGRVNLRLSNPLCQLGD